MKNIATMHHFVHLGFDWAEQKWLEEVIKYRINIISNKVGFIVNLVDQVIPTKIEAETREIERLAESLSFFLEFKNPWTKDPNIEKKHPKEVLEFVSGLWEINNLKSENITEKELLKARENIIKNDFLGMLNQMIEHFRWMNIYWLRHSEEFESRIPKNESRRTEIYEYAIKKLWEERVIITWMDDWDQWKIDPRNKWVSYKWNFWNAQQFLTNNRDQVNKLKAERLRDRFFNELDERWLVINPEETRHVLGWEYLNRCVIAFWKILWLYGIKKDLISQDDSIWLIKK